MHLRQSTITGINQLPDQEKKEIYARLIPPDLLNHFNISPDLLDNAGHELFTLDCQPGDSTTELYLYHQHSFPDPVLYGHLTDTLNGIVHVLLYIVNDPNSPRFSVDRLPDGTPTLFGTLHRNLEAEEAAMNAGLSPGQVRSGLRMLHASIQQFEFFVDSLGHNLFYNEPLYYHNAYIFERYGFGYQVGRRQMEGINAGFAPGGALIPLLDGSTPFRQPEAAESIRLRSWAIHDGILGTPFTNVTMYKMVGKTFSNQTTDDIPW